MPLLKYVLAVAVPFLPQGVRAPAMTQYRKVYKILIIKNSEPPLMSSRINKILLFQPSKKSLQESLTNFHKLMVCPFFHNHSGIYKDFYL